MALSCWHGFGRSSFMKGSKFPQMFKFHYYFLQRNYASDSVMVMNHLLMLQRMLLNERTFIYFSNIQGFGSKRNVVEYIKICGPGSSVDIVTGYGLDVPGIESRRGRIFRACPDRSWGPPSLLYNRYRVCCRIEGCKMTGQWRCLAPTLKSRAITSLPLWTCIGLL